MSDDFVFAQIKEVVITSEKTVTKITEKLETVDFAGRKKCIESSHCEVEHHNSDKDMGRAA